MLETSIVVGPARHGDLDDLVAEMGAEIVAFNSEHARIARVAYARFGTGARSAARLNFGDCMSYALAKERGEPLLFKDEDFQHTDVTAAL